ncbi:MAG: helix-turn-helix domain-containing protein [Bacteroidales bacterium]
MIPFLPMQYLFVSTAALILFMISLLISKKDRRISDNLLAMWLFVFFANMVTLFIVNSDPKPDNLLIGFIVEFSEASLFLHGPLLFFYTISLTRPNFRLAQKHLLHSIPFFISYLYLILGLFFEIGSQAYGRLILLLIKLIWIGFYLIYNILILQKHKANIEKIFSNLEEKTLKWLNFISIGVFILWITGVVSYTLNEIFDFNIPQYGGLYMNFLLCVFVFLLGYFGFRQTSVFSMTVIQEKTTGEIADIEEIVESVPGIETKYKKSGLDAGKTNEIIVKMLQLLTDKKIYLDQNLTLFKMAEILKVQPNHLSQVINSTQNQSFFNFINSYRIEEVKKNINSDKMKNFSLLGIAFECGFNSKASFNRAFKKHTGLTPSEYKKSKELKISA